MGGKQFNRPLIQHFGAPPFAHIGDVALSLGNLIAIFPLCLNFRDFFLSLTELICILVKILVNIL